MGMSFWFKRDRAVGLSDEETRTVLRALRRSAEAMPEPTETFGSREMRARRETKLAERLGTMVSN